MDPTFIDNFFSALNPSQDQQSTVAKYSLVAAAQLMQKKKYPEAITQLKKAIALDPTSQDAYSTLGSLYLQTGNTKGAVDAYKNQIRVNPSSADAYNSLGNAYLQAGNQADAEKAYKTSARMDGSTTYAPYALGNMYLQQGRYAEATTQFAKVVSIAPQDAHGYYGLAAVDNKQGNFSAAVTQANRAINLDKTFAEPHFELGKAYLGLGEKDEARKQQTILDTMNATMASDLNTMLTAPKMVSSLPSSSSFNILKQPDTLLKTLDPSLLFPNSSKDFTLAFQFDSQMDAASVMNVANWSISKASGGQEGLYNNGITLHQATQVSVPSTPKRVIYDPQTMQATVFFTLSQNSAVNAEIDPSHIVFKFSGTDANGKAIDPSADQVDGAAGLPF
jgi:Flp pilus assembly protein TadD